jgi:DNA-binding response OmpR family regulator
MTMMLRASLSAVPSSTRILLVAGCQLVGETLQAALVSHGFDVAISARPSAAGTLDEVRAQRPGVVVLDLDRAGPASAATSSRR